MASLLFSNVLKQAERKHNPKFGSVILRDFLRDKALEATSKNQNPNRFINTKKAKANVVTTLRPGTMVCYFYDAKHKASLPYWDKFPVIFPLELYKDGWLGLNMHYLPPIFRARLMDELYDLLNNQKYDETTKLNLSYQLLKSASKFSYYKPCIKRYLASHVQSQMIEIDVKEWDYAMMLPLARFQKASARKVWDDSINKIQKAN